MQRCGTPSSLSGALCASGPPQRSAAALYARGGWDALCRALAPSTCRGACKRLQSAMAWLRNKRKKAEAAANGERNGSDEDAPKTLTSTPSGGSEESAVEEEAPHAPRLFRHSIELLEEVRFAYGPAAPRQEVGPSSTSGGSCHTPSPPAALRMQFGALDPCTLCPLCTHGIMCSEWRRCSSTTSRRRPRSGPPSRSRWVCRPGRHPYYPPAFRPSSRYKPPVLTLSYATATRPRPRLHPLALTAACRLPLASPSGAHAVCALRPARRGPRPAAHFRPAPPAGPADHLVGAGHHGGHRGHHCGGQEPHPRARAPGQGARHQRCASLVCNNVRAWQPIGPAPPRPAPSATRHCCADASKRFPGSLRRRIN